MDDCFTAILTPVPRTAFVPPVIVRTELVTSTRLAPVKVSNTPEPKTDPVPPVTTRFVVGADVMFPVVAALISVPLPCKIPVTVVERVMAGALVEVATVPARPFADTTDTEVTVPPGFEDAIVRLLPEGVIVMFVPATNTTSPVKVFKLVTPPPEPFSGGQLKLGITHPHRNKSFGYYKTAKEASEAREKAAKDLFGEFYRT